jgi:hypothetical protein
MAVDTTTHFKISASETSGIDLGTRAVTHLFEFSPGLSTGTGANQADVVFSDERTLSASATEDLDLAGILVPAFGGTLTMVKLKCIAVYALAANTNNVNVTRPATNGVPLFTAVSSGLPILPGGVFIWFAPGASTITVTASTGDLITFTNSAGSTSVTYRVVLIGTSA